MSHHFTFHTWLEHCDAEFRKFKSTMTKERSGWAKLPDLSESKVFWLGDDAQFYKHVQEIRDELMDDMKEKVPLPFKDCAHVSTFMHGGDLGRIWSIDRIIENPDWYLECVPPDQKAEYERSAQQESPRQRLMILRYQVAENENTPPTGVVVWMVDYHGIEGEHMTIGLVRYGVMVGRLKPPHEEAMKVLSNESKIVLDEIAAVSHPENYVVAVRPELTPKEQRRVEAGKTFPVQKRPHFIVMDHTVLVQTRAEHMGTHAPPIPHERRGHWRRLAERCRHAKLMGKEKVFVRPTIVGDLKWKGPGAIYEVLPQLNAQSSVEPASNR